MAAMLGASVPGWSQGITERVSVGEVRPGHWLQLLPPVLSADRRFVAFSKVGNLVPGGTNRSTDVFVRTLLGEP